MPLNFKSPALVGVVGGLDNPPIPLYSDDFTGGDSWLDSFGGFPNGVDLAEDEFFFNEVQASGFNITNTHDLGNLVVSDTNWVLRIHQLNFSTLTADTTTTMQIYMTNGNVSHTYAIGSPTDFIGARFKYATSLKRLETLDGENINPIDDVADAFDNFTLLTGTDYYLECRRLSSTSFDVALYSDSNFSTELAKATGVCSVGTTNLRYIKVQNSNGQSSESGTLEGTFQKVEFFNNISSV